MIESLQSLRGIFAILIFLHHYTVDGSSLCTFGGDCGVAFFLILSGMVLSRSYDGRSLGLYAERKRFWFARFSRIYPLHLVCLLGFVLLHIRSLDMTQFPVLTANLFLLQSWVPVSEVYFSGNAVSWFLSDLCFCYLLFPVIHRYLSRSFREIRVVIVSFLCLYFILVALLPVELIHPIVYIFPAMRIVDFIIGIILWKVLAEKIFVVNRSVRNCTLLEACAIGLMLVFILGYSHVPVRLGLASYWWFPVIVILFVFTNEGKNAYGLISKALCWRPLVILGNISFSFYMIHLMVIHAVGTLSVEFGLEAVAWPLMLIGTFGCTVMVASVVHRCFEIPVCKICQKLYYETDNKRL